MTPNIRLLILAAFLFPAAAQADPAGYYTDGPAIFSTRPDPAKSTTTLSRVGPIGLSIDLIQPAFTMKINSIEKGSPAEATGALKPGQIIETVNGKKLADINPYVQIANWIAEAEASDGKLVLAVAEKPGGPTKDVSVSIPVLGAYSATWPLDCPKSDKIVRNFAEYLKQPGADRGFGDIGMLFLLSTGDDKDLETVKAWTREVMAKGMDRFPHQWVIAYGGLALCEYYLRTGDAEVLPMIQAVADKAISMERFGGWGNRHPLAAVTYGGGGGHLNASGTLCVAYLLLAKECGAKMADDDLNRILTHFYRWAGRGNVPYGNNKPESGLVDNGKNGQLAFVMAAAAGLTPNGEDSIYAKARDTMALYSFPSTGFMLHGHTGGGIGEISRSNAMGLLTEKFPALYREFMDQRRWHYELSRRFDGSFGIFGGARYDVPSWGAGYALGYTVPRKTLRLTGAPLSPHAKQFQLPERPWGTAEDDDFESIESAVMPDGTRQDISNKTLAEAGGMALSRIVGGDPDAATVMSWIHNPVMSVREMFLKHMGKLGAGTILGLLNSEDARLRHIAAKFLSGEELDETYRSAEIHDRLTAMLRDEKESLYVKTVTLDALGRFPKDTLVGDVDLILPFMEHKEWWLNHSALMALAPVMDDTRAYKRIFPAIRKLLDGNYNYAIQGSFRWSKIPEILREAPEEVQKAAQETFSEVLAEYKPYHDPIETLDKLVNPQITDVIAYSIINLPGGYDMLYHAAKQNQPDVALPFEKIFLTADPKDFSPELRAAVGKVIESRLIPEYVGQFSKELATEATSDPSKSHLIRMDELTKLYDRMGVEKYNWNDFGPSLDAMEWNYLSFDPAEKMAWDQPAIPRFRPVTLPSGSENFFATAFDAKKAGWKTGHQPFGAFNGNLVTETTEQCQDWCRHELPMKTLWDKEVLLMTGTFSYPPLKPGHRYRILVGGMSHVGGGEGFRVYLDGEQFYERPRGVWSREGGRPIAKVIDTDFRPKFDDGKVTISYMGFMNEHKGDRKQHVSIWLQEMEVPPVAKGLAEEGPTAK